MNGNPGEGGGCLSQHEPLPSRDTMKARQNRHSSAVATENLVGEPVLADNALVVSLFNRLYPFPRGMWS